MMEISFTALHTTDEEEKFQLPYFEVDAFEQAGGIGIPSGTRPEVKICLLQGTEKYPPRPQTTAAEDALYRAIEMPEPLFSEIKTGIRREPRRFKHLDYAGKAQLRTSSAATLRRRDDGKCHSKGKNCGMQAIDQPNGEKNLEEKYQ